MCNNSEIFVQVSRKPGVKRVVIQTELVQASIVTIEKIMLSHGQYGNKETDADEGGGNFFEKKKRQAAGTKAKRLIYSYHEKALHIQL